MPTLLEIYNDPNYQNANEATKRAIFEKYSGKDANYTSANDATKAAIRQKFGIADAEELELKRPEPEKVTAPSDVTKRENPFVGSAEAGYERLKGELGLLAGKVGLMKPEEAEKYRAEQEAKAAEIYTPTKEGWKEAPFTKFGELAGGSLPYMVAPLAVGTGAALAPEAALAATLATGATSALQFTGSDLARQMEANQQSLADTSLLKAGAAAIPQAALDVVGLKMIPGVRQIFNKAGLELSEKAAEEVAKKNLLATAGSYAKATGKAAGAEGATEAAQQVLERLQAGLNIADEEARREYFESFVGGAVLGGAFAIPGKAFESMAAKGKEQPAPTTPTPTPTAPTTPTPTPVPATTTQPEMVTSTDDAVNKLLNRGGDNVGTDGRPTSPSVTVLGTRGRKPDVATTTESTVDTVGMGGVRDDTTGTEKRADGKYAALDAEIAATREKLKAKAASVAKAPKTKIPTTPEVTETVDKETEKAIKLLEDASVEQDEVIKQAKVERAKQKAEATFTPKEIPGYEYFEEVGDKGQPITGFRRIQELSDTEKEEEKKIVETPQSQEVLSKLVSDPNTPQYKKDLAQKFLHPYVLSKSEAAERAPQGLDEALKIAAYEDAADDLDLIAIEKRNTALSKKAEELNAARQQEYNNRVEQLVKEKGMTPHQARLELGGFKKQLYTASSMYDVLGPEEYHKFSTQFLDEEEQAAQADPARQAQINLRKDFINNLSPEQRAKFDALKQGFIAEDYKVASKRTRAESSKKAVTKVQTPEQLAKAEEAAEKKAFDKQVQAVRKTLARQKKFEQAVKTETPTYNTLKAGLLKMVRAGINANTSALDVLKGFAGRESNREFASQIVADHLAKTMERVKGDVAIKFGSMNTDIAGMFDPKTNTITINDKYEGSRTIDDVVNHEVMHYLLDHIIDNPKNITYAQKQAIKELRSLHKLAKQQLGSKYTIPNLKEFVAETMSNAEFQADLARIPSLNKPSLLTRIAEVISNALGFRKYAETQPYVLQHALNNIEAILTDKGYAIPSPEMHAKTVSFARQRRQAENNPATNFSEIEKQFKDKIAVPTSHELASVVWSGMKNPRKTYRTMVRMFQNASAPLKNWQRNVQLRNKLISDTTLTDENGNTKFNNVYTLLMNAAAKSDILYQEYVGDLNRQLEEKMTNLVRAYGSDFKTTLAKLSTYITGLHEPERRRLLFLKNLKLNNIIKVRVNGVEGTPADIHKLIFDALKRSDVTEAEAKFLRQTLDALVFTDPGNLTSPNATERKGVLNTRMLDPQVLADNPEAFDENSINYSPVASYTPDQIDMILQELQNDPQVDKVMEIIGPNGIIPQISEQSKELAKLGNYWSPQVSNHVAFYGFKFYVPFKGKPELAEQQQDTFFDTGNDPLSRNFHEAAIEAQGRRTLSDNPIAQVTVDAKKAAFIAAQNEVAEATGNAIRQGLIPTNVKNKGPYKTIKFENRATELTESELAKRDTIFHYKDNGDIDIYTISDPSLMQSLRRPYKNWGKVGTAIFDSSGWLTRAMGKGFTLYNPFFAPWNFARDTLTNLYNLTIDRGVMTGTKTLLNTVKMATVDTLAGGGMLKAGKAMHLYQGNNMKRLKQLADSGDKFYKDFYDLAKEGGIVTYLQGVANRTEIIKMSDEINKGNLTRLQEFVTKGFEYWFNMFEATARVAAFGAIKDHIKQSNPNISDDAAITQASFETKDLANFEQAGTYGKEMGSFYMFARAQATGSVRAIDSLSYVLPVEVAIKDLPPEVRNDPAQLEEFKKNYNAKAVRARLLTASLVGMGMVLYNMALMGSDDDELGENKIAKDDSSLWVRAARFTIPGTEKVVQIPYGFGLGSFMAWGAQMANFGQGNQTLGEFISNSAQIGIDSFIPLPVSRIPFNEDAKTTVFAVWDTISPTAMRPVFQYMMNMNGLGQEIYNDEERSKLPAALTSRGYVPESYRELSEYLFDVSDGSVNVSPSLLMFFTSSYMNGLSLFGQNVENMALLSSGDKEFNAKSDTIIFNSFIGNQSNYEAKEFNRVEKIIKNLKQKVEGKKLLMSDYAFIDKHPDIEVLINMYDSDIAGPLKNLQAQANQIRNDPNMPKIEREELLKSNKLDQKILKADLIKNYKYLEESLRTRRDENVD